MDRRFLPKKAVLVATALIAAPALAATAVGWIAGSPAFPWLAAILLATALTGGFVAHRWVGEVRRLKAEHARLAEAAEAEPALRRALRQAEVIVAALPDPVILVGRSRIVVDANLSARRLFGETIVSQDLAVTIRHPQVLDMVDQVLRQGGSARIDYQVTVPVERLFEVMVQDLAPGAAGAKGDPAAVVVLHDMTAVRRAERMRGDFVANASHELRTPLATLAGFIETLAGPARDDPEARDRFLAIMAEQAGRMSRLVSDLLSLSRIELDEHTRPAGSVDPVRTVRSVIDALEMKAKGKRKAVALIVEGAPLTIEGDGDQISQIVQNLVDNAINYSRPGTEVRVTVRRAASRSGRGEGVEIAVADQGEGIPKEHLPRLTERFYRVDPARSRAMGGTGLGLAIVKHIVARHRGRLAIDSVEGEGSTFTVWLPATGERAAEPAARNVAGAAAGPVIKR